MSPLLLLLVAVAAAPTLASAASPLHGVANDVLSEYGLPKGLIPDSVTSYTFDNATGDFQIQLAGTCYVWFGDHYVYYEQTISGTISYGAISNLSGIQAKKFFIWVYVSGMVAHPEKGTIEFRAGPISEDVPMSLFAAVPVCGNGIGAGSQLRGAAGVIRDLGLLPVAECPQSRSPRKAERKSQTPTTMSPLTLLLVAVAVAAAPLASAAGGASANGAANDLLPKYGLPKGLIPDSVASYSFDETTGDFEIRLAGTCYVWFGDHLVYYEKTIRGCLSSGKITSLSGIQAKKLFLWVSVSGIVAHPKDGTLEFQVGFVSEELSASLFDKVPVCGASAGAQLRGVAGVIRELGLLPVAED